MNYLVTLLLDDGPDTEATLAPEEIKKTCEYLAKRVPEILDRVDGSDYEVRAVRVRTTAEALGLARR